MKIEITLLIVALLMAVLGVAYVKGYDLVKAKSAENLPRFYLIMVAIRMLLVLTTVGIAVLLADNRDDAVSIALASMAMYVVMMGVTLKLRH